MHGLKKINYLHVLETLSNPTKNNLEYIPHIYISYSIHTGQQTIVTRQYSKQPKTGNSHHKTPAKRHSQLLIKKSI